MSFGWLDKEVEYRGNCRLLQLQRSLRVILALVTQRASRFRNFKTISGQKEPNSSNRGFSESNETNQLNGIFNCDKIEGNLGHEYRNKGSNFMKLKVLAVAGIVVVIAVVIVACGQTKGNGEPSSVASSSVASSQIVTDVSDLPTDSTIVEDTSLAAPVPSAEPVQEQPTQTAPEPETEKSTSEVDEEAIQEYMSVGLTREEAEARLAGIRQEQAAQQESAAKAHEEWEEEHAKDIQEGKDAYDKFARENYGISGDELKKLNSTEASILASQYAAQKQQQNNS